MNLVIVSVLLLGMLAFQPTLIYGAKNMPSTANNHNSGSNGKGKKHHLRTAAFASPSSTAKLVMAMQSGDVLVRAARGATDDAAAQAPAAASKEMPVNVENGATATVGGGGGKQRNKHNHNNGNGNKKSNKHSTQAENAPAAGTRKHLDRKFSAGAANQQQQQQQQQQEKPLHQHHQQQQQQHGNSNKNNKQRQVLKSQQSHQNHGKRSGLKTKPETGTAAGEKNQSTCRYVKSAWSECDAKTNTHSRTLTLRKGEGNCLQTRTVMKKCKKACRYEKGAWSECSSGQMTRQDKLKSTGGQAEANCEPLRNINKKCNPGGGGAGRGAGGKVNKERKIKEKASRRAQA